MTRIKRILSAALGLSLVAVAGNSLGRLIAGSPSDAESYNHRQRDTEEIFSISQKDLPETSDNRPVHTLKIATALMDRNALGPDDLMGTQTATIRFIQTRGEIEVISIEANKEELPGMAVAITAIVSPGSSVSYGNEVRQSKDILIQLSATSPDKMVSSSGESYYRSGARLSTIVFVTLTPTVPSEDRENNGAYLISMKSGPSGRDHFIEFPESWRSSWDTYFTAPCLI